MVKLLMDHGAKIYARNNGGQRPRDVAISTAIKKILTQAEINQTEKMEAEMSRANGPTRLTKEVMI